MTMANTRGLSPAQVLAALYNASAPHPETGMGWFHYVPGDISMVEAEALAAKWVKPGYHYDYIKGRPMKVKNLHTVAEGFVDVEHYDASFENPGKGQRAIDYHFEQLQREAAKSGSK